MSLQTCSISGEVYLYFQRHRSTEEILNKWAMLIPPNPHALLLSQCPLIIPLPSRQPCINPEHKNRFPCCFEPMNLKTPTSKACMLFFSCSSVSSYRYPWHEPARARSLPSPGCSGGTHVMRFSVSVFICFSRTCGGQMERLPFLFYVMKSLHDPKWRVRYPTIAMIFWDINFILNANVDICFSY